MTTYTKVPDDAKDLSYGAVKYLLAKKDLKLGVIYKLSITVSIDSVHPEINCQVGGEQITCEEMPNQVWLGSNK